MLLEEYKRMKYWKTFKIYIFWKFSCEGNFHGIRVKRKCMYLLSNIPIHTMHAHRLNVLVIDYKKKVFTRNYNMRNNLCVLSIVRIVHCSSISARL
jgi:hypothetical protein